MKRIAFIIGTVLMMLAYQDAHAQGFWYLPPGGDFSYRYGIDLGNGLGYGFAWGYGYGSVVSPEAATASAYADLLQFQSLYGAPLPQVDDEDEFSEEDEGFANQQMLPVLQTEIAGNEKVNLQKAQQQVSHPKSNLAQHVTLIEFDRATGKVNWPAALSREAFSIHRSEMEVLLVSVAKTGITPGLKAQIDDKTQEIHDAIRRQHRALTSKEYSEGHRFINRLAYEAQLPTS